MSGPAGLVCYAYGAALLALWALAEARPAWWGVALAAARPAPSVLAWAVLF